MVRSIAIPDTQYILIESNAKYCTTYVIPIIQLVTHQGKNLHLVCSIIKNSSLQQ